MRQQQEDIFQGHGVEVDTLDRDSFLKVRETLTRIGVPSREGKRLFQSCHVLHKRGRYSILHFKELFALDGRSSTMTDEDFRRRDKIVGMLKDWGLVKVIGFWRDPEGTPPKIKIIRHFEKNEWELVPKHSLGRRD